MVQVGPECTAYRSRGRNKRVAARVRIGMEAIMFSKTIKLSAAAILCAIACGCGAEQPGAAIGETEDALYGPGDTGITVVRQLVNFNGSTAPKRGRLGLTAFTTAPQWYTVTLAPNGPASTACPPFAGG